MTAHDAPVPQPVATPLTRAAIFLVLTIRPDAACAATVRAFLPDLSGFVRSVCFRDPRRSLSCVLGIGAAAWDRLTGLPRPPGLHPFVELRAGARHAVSTPGDLLLHIRADHIDLCFELARQIRTRLGEAVAVVDEVHGFRYFDARDLLGFVDGTENPGGNEAEQAVLVGDEDPAHAGSSYVIVQKYLHDLAAWNAIPVEVQEKIIGRTKLDDMELPDAAKASYAHNVLTSIEEGGRELKILRDNMPFGRIGDGEYGTYFIGYARTPSTIEKMLRNMFIGLPEGNYDRLLDVSRPVTGSLFFVPTATFLDAVEGEPAVTGDPAPAQH
ncbi:Dyp-type peroxidase [Tahibacter harae]|uniref:Dyp-type peroxidase n=1 Tax=Tahibacter harae TaxID=2963937 RepID=A0ABT1QYZ8_9GAMM|nr:Dyp-type peroxidase [Tahibacter harae]MCQ4167480.1 Dyp-type peroxidase [Tahibacter harae]